MTAAFTERDWDRIEQAGYTQFVATPVAEALPRHRVKLRGKRHEQYSEAYRNFRDVMESANPPQSKEEAIRQIVGLLGKLLAIIFPQYALLIAIIGFLWDVSTGNDVTIRHHVFCNAMESQPIGCPGCSCKRLNEISGVAIGESAGTMRVKYVDGGPMKPRPIEDEASNG